uniref:Spindle assembly protein putative n=1 Tax=Albugo laibachii Nc14 TaxID=890382 RepID=F0W756_9STRA|nr:spindle assembly protein putative [Albugo laibachii Nc14]|eukprot:CCA16955.1 spindle assembly protein putative [Albugo laibachii Nc14]
MRFAMEEYNRETPLFDQRLTILLQSKEKEEKQLPITVRLLTGSRPHAISNQKEKVLRVELTDDDGIDPYFLYLWSISEEEFHEVKQQQRLLVDFENFPIHLINLLECCLKTELKLQSCTDKQAEDAESDNLLVVENSSRQKRSFGPEPLSYLAVLNVSESDISTFSVVETNIFKHLTHLSLPFQAGNDEAVKSYLASRLCQRNLEKRRLIGTLTHTREQLKHFRDQNKKLERSLEDVERKHSVQSSQEAMRFTEEIHSQREKAAIMLKELETEHAKKVDSLLEKYEHEASELRIKVQEQEKELHALTKTNYQQSVKADQLSTQSDELHREKQALEKQVIELRSQNKELDHRVFTQEKSITQMEIRLQALSQQLDDKDQVLMKTSQLLEGAQAQKHQVDESLGVYRDNHAILHQKLELSVAEINKGNEVIEQMQKEIQNLRQKAKSRVKIIKQQEQEARQSTGDNRHQMEDLRIDLQKRDEHILHLEEKNSDLMRKLEDSNKVLESNQQVIQWLNKEITETQMAARKHDNASVFAYHPTSKKAMEKELAFGPIANCQ